jgi:hypothetical protein
VGYVYLDTEVGEQFDVVGLSSSEQTYRLAWMFNLAFQWKLRKVVDIECRQRYGISNHDCYMYQSENKMLTIHLIDNKTPDGILIQEMSTFDFMLKIVDHNEERDELFYQKLKRLPLIMACMQMDMIKLNKSAHVRYLEVLG